MAPSPQRGGNFFQPITNREAIFWVLSSGKVFPDWQQELWIYCMMTYNLQRWVQSGFSALPCTWQRCCVYIYALSACIHECKHALLSSYRFASLFVKAFCRLHMPALGVVVPSLWDDMKANSTGLVTLQAEEQAGTCSPTGSAACV